MYTVRLYYNTGFNSINIPDSPAILNSMSYTDFPALDLLQARELSEISIRATYDQVKNADYCALIDSNSSVFYAVEGSGIKMTSSDVAVIPLLIDYLTTAGGVGSLEILDGITERHHVALADDTFGTYAEDDPYLVASKPLEIVTGASFPARDVDSQGNPKEFVLAESTSKLTQMGYAKDEPIAKKCVQYESGTEVASVTIPDTAPLEQSEYSKVGIWGYKSLDLAGSALYVLKNPNDASVGKNSRDGISALRSIGCESAILNAYSIPTEFIRASAPSTGTDNVEKADGTTGTVSGERVTKIDGVAIDQLLSANTMPYVYDSNVKNKRVLYGELNRICISSIATGNQLSVKPEEIYRAGDTQPTLQIFADPRPSGRPYFRFKYLHGHDDAPFMDAIPGARWQTAPLVYTDKSGSDLETTRLSASQNIARDRMEMGLLSQMTGDITGTASGFITGRPSANGFGGDLLARGISAGIGLYEGADASQQNYVMTALSPYARRRHDFEQEMAMQDINLGLSQVVAPVVSFPRADGIRDYIGNQVYLYRYRPSATDLAKQDKILTMYGYRDTTPLTSAMLTNRAKFNYIKATGVSVKTNLPRWINDGIAGMFRIGIRIWHVAPNSACYTDGTNV